MSVSSSYLVYSRLKPSLVSVLISVLISVSISVPISFRGQTRYGLGLISKKPSSFKKKPSFIQEKTEFFSSENRGQNKRPLGFLRWQLRQAEMKASLPGPRFWWFSKVHEKTMIYGARWKSHECPIRELSIPEVVPYLSDENKILPTQFRASMPF